jgi:hypothetical protein
MSSDRAGSGPAELVGRRPEPLAAALLAAAVLEADTVLRRGAWASGRELELGDLFLIAETIAEIRLELGLP